MLDDEMRWICGGGISAGDKQRYNCLGGVGIWLLKSMGYHGLKVVKTLKVCWRRIGTKENAVIFNEKNKIYYRFVSKQYAANSNISYKTKHIKYQINKQ